MVLDEEDDVLAYIAGISPAQRAAAAAAQSTELDELEAVLPPGEAADLHNLLNGTGGVMDFGDDWIDGVRDDGDASLPAAGRVAAPTARHPLVPTVGGRAARRETLLSRTRRVRN